MEREKTDKLEKIIKSYTKKFGKDEIYLGTDLKKTKEEVISTGILTLDLALGIGGIPTGKMIEVYGQESSGKTSLSLILTAKMQEAGKICAFIDAESSFDPSWAASLGVDLDNLLLVETNSLEDALEKVEFLLSEGVGFLAFDSIAAPPTAQQAAADYGDSLVGVRARVLSMALSKLMPILRENKSTILFINQIREKIGVYGNPETTPGGRALKFFSSIRMNLKKKPLKNGEEYTGDEINIVVEKNKFAPPMRKAKFLLMYDGTYTIDYPEILQKLGLVEKSGAWYKELVTGQTFHGANALMEQILSDKQFKDSVDNAIRQKILSLNNNSVFEEDEDKEKDE